MSNIWVECLKEKQRLQKELLKCPFCGSDDLSVHLDDGFSYYVWCGNCGSLTDNDHLTEKEVIEAWNTRPAEDALKAEIERLKEALESICLVAAFPSPCPEYIEQVRGIAKEALDKMQIRTGRDD